MKKVSYRTKIPYISDIYCFYSDDEEKGSQRKKFKLTHGLLIPPLLLGSINSFISIDTMSFFYDKTMKYKKN